MVTILQKPRIAVVLFNLGGPDSKEAIEPFLKNFFTDPNIIRLPLFLRTFIAGRIAAKRSKREAGVSYGELGDKSPLLENSQAQAALLEHHLNADGKTDNKVFICMRYWHPMAPEVAQAVKDYDPSHIVLLPLYPQFSTTTTRSSFQAWDAAGDDIDLMIPTSVICCYPFEDGFINASADNIKTVYETALRETGKKPRLLLSAHGLPESVIKDGDPYQWQCEQSAARIAAATGIENLDWQICYQSRVGPMKWIQPSTEEALHKAAADNVPVIILPHAFTQEHVETLVEIEIEYRHVATKIGVPGFYRVPTVSTHPAFIEGLVKIVQERGYQTWTSPDAGKRICPSGYCRCGMI
jgi:ferrochelatase